MKQLNKTPINQKPTPSTSTIMKEPHTQAVKWERFGRARALAIIILFLGISFTGNAQWTTKLRWSFGRARALALMLLFIGIGYSSNAQWMLINQSGGSPNSSAALELQSTSRGFLAPRMTTTQMNAIGSPAAGLLIYNTDSSAFFYNNGSGWSNIASAGATQFAVPAGSIVSFAGDTSNIPAGFLLCNGASLATASYSELFSAVGYAWGGSGSSFNLPDLRGRFLRGTNLGSGNDPDAASRTAMNTGGNTGDKVGTIQADQFESHFHNIANPGFQGNGTGTAHGSQYNTGNAGGVWDTDSKGGNETRPINANVNYIICYSSSIAAAGTNSSVFQGSISAAQLPNSVQDSSRITDNDGSAKVQALSSDRIIFTTNSSETMRITSVGRVGIGSSAPDSLLTVAGGIKAENIRLTTGAGANQVLTAVDNTGKAEWRTPTASPWNASGSDVYRASGNVGIGTTSPTSALEVNYDGSPQISVAPKTTNTGQIAEFRLMGATHKSDTSRTASIVFGNYDQDFTSTKFMGSISGETTNNAQNEGDMVFYRYPNGNTPTEAIRIERFGDISFHSGTDSYTFPTTRGTNNQLLSTDASGSLSWTSPASSPWSVNGSDVYRSSGMVGIGIANPTKELHVSGDVKINGSGDLLELANTSGTVYGTVGIADGNGRLSIYENADTDGDKLINAEEANRLTMSTNGIKFYTAPSGTAGSNISWNERLFIETDGNVGISNSAPDSLLSVGGGIEAENIRLSNGASANKVLTSDASGNASWQTPTASPWTVSGSDVYRSSGLVGIGTASPHGALHIGNSAGGFRKIILFENSNNDYQYYGFGISPSSLRYSVAATAARHLFVAGNSATSTDTLMVIQGNGNVGIGTATPNARLQLDNALTNRKIVLWQNTNNDHEFTGFGVTGGVFRYQTPGSTSDHVFYSAINSTSSQELMRIAGDGNVGIGTSSPARTLHVHQATASANYFQISNSSTGATGTDGLQMGITGDGAAYIMQKENANMIFRTNNVDRLMLSGAGAITFNNSTNAYTFPTTRGTNNQVLSTDASGNISWTSIPSSADNLGNHTATQNVKLSGNWLSNDGGNEGVFVSTDGKVGIGTSAPNGLLQFTGGNIIRKIVLNQGADNDFQFSGFGINSGSMLYSVHTNTRDHIFYAATSASARNELMRIRGTGNVGIGTTSPSEKLEVNNGNAKIGTTGEELLVGSIGITNYAGISHANSGTPGYNHYAIAHSAAGQLRLNSSPGQAMMFYRGGQDVLMQFDAAGDMSVLNNTLFVDSSTSRVGIGKNTPAYALDVVGDVMANGNNFIVLDSAGNNIEFSGQGSSTLKSYGAYIRTTSNPPNGGAIFRVLSSGGAERLRVEHSGYVRTIDGLTVGGNVGIGNTTPTATLDVSGNAKVSGKTTTGTLQVTTGASANNVLTSDASGNATWQAVPSSADNLGNHTATTDLAMANKKISNVAQIDVGGSAVDGIVGIKYANPNALNLQATNNNDSTGITFQNPGGNYAWKIHRQGGANPDIVFAGGANQVGYAGLPERMRLTAGGNLGIGSVNPASLLHLYDGSAPYLQLTNSVTGVSATDGLRIGVSGNHVFFRNYENGDIRFRTQDQNRLVVMGNGDVGVGTASPLSTFHVAGGTILVDNTNGLAYRNAANSGNRNLIKSTSGDDVIIAGTNTNNVEFDVSGGNNAMYIETGGNVGIGTSNPGNKLEVNGTANGAAIVKIVNNSSNALADGIDMTVGSTGNITNSFIIFKNGSGTAIGRIRGNGLGGTAYQTTSDRRLKTNIQDFAGGLELIGLMKPRVYERKSKLGVQEVGFIAQELQHVFPQMVSGDSTSDVKDKPMMVGYSDITPVLTAGIKELHELVKQQQAIINGQQERIEQLEAKEQSYEELKKSIEGEQKVMKEKLEQIEKMMITGQLIKN